MSDQTRAEPEESPCLEAVLTVYLLAEEAGKAPDRAQLLAAFPQLAQELTAFFECRQEVPSIPGARPDTDLSARPMADFELLEVLGRGGMGIVYKARQKTLNRLVAVKVIRAEDHAAEDIERFRREAEKLAGLIHPHVVQVFAA